MRKGSFSSTADSVSPSSSDRPLNNWGKAPIPKFFTIQQVAELLEVSTRTVRRRIDAGLLVAHRSGWVVRIADHDLRAFLAQHRGN
jgi:excisionase family DNA binding protein